VTVQSTLTSDVLDVAAHEAAVAHPAAGAVVSFAGVVRDHDGGRHVTRLVYEAHPSAEAVLAGVAAMIALRTPLLDRPLDEPLPPEDVAPEPGRL